MKDRVSIERKHVRTLGARVTDTVARGNGVSASSYLSAWESTERGLGRISLDRDFGTGILCGFGNMVDRARARAERCLLAAGRRAFGERWDEGDAKALLDVIVYGPVLLMALGTLLMLPAILS